jgi:rhamnogalacturonyl hydrolase YesR
MTPAPLLAQRWDVGLSASGTVIEGVARPGAPAGAPTVLLVGGLDGTTAGETRVREALASDRRTDVRLVGIADGNPDGSPLAFPPQDTAYRQNPESHALWRWIGVHAPDLVLIAGEDSGLAAALSAGEVAGVGAIPARRVTSGGALLDEIPAAIPPSPARLERSRRQARTPAQVAAELAAVYGHAFDQVTYLPGMALIGRLRLGALSEVESLAARYLETPPPIRSSLTIAGHLVFAELAERTGRADYLALTRSAADLAFDERGAPLEAMPMHGEMSDAFFMAGPVLARTGRLTGDARYFDMVGRHVRFMNGLTLRPDGLYRHSPLTEAAWSRANAFPALGMALLLSDVPESHVAFPDLRDSFRRHMAALLPFQDADGMWHVVVDHPGSYAELSATAMIGTAMLRGVRRGWLDADTYQPRVDAAWRGVLARTGSDGSLVDVCESTNKQESLEAYLNRAAILGRDERGGGMMLIFATEMAGLR